MDYPSLHTSTEKLNVSTSQHPITPLRKHGSTQSASHEHRGIHTSRFQRQLLIRPLPSRSSCSSSSAESSRSYETPITSPEPSPSTPLLNPLAKVTETLYTEQPRTPTPSPGPRRRSSRSSPAEVKPRLKANRPKPRTKAARTSNTSFLSDERRRREAAPLSLTKFEKAQSLGDPLSVDGDNTRQVRHEGNKNTAKSTGEPSRQALDTSTVTAKEQLFADISQREKYPEEDGMSDRDGTNSDTVAELKLHLNLPGSFPEDHFFSRPSLQKPTSQMKKKKPQLPSPLATKHSSPPEETILSHEHIKPYPHFVRRYPYQLSQHSIHQEISNELLRPLTKSSRPGSIYIYKPKSPQITHVKIGRTARQPDRRTKEQQKCNIGELLQVWQQERPVQNHERLERLVQRELANLNYTFECEICKKKGKDAPTTHDEWFLLCWDRAATVVARWNNWMYSHNPYDRSGDLKLFWRERLEKYKYTCASPANADADPDPLRPRDMSETVWTFQNTELYWDWWVEPMAMEIWWFHFRRTVSLCWNIVRLCVAVLSDQANLRAALTFILLMVVGSAMLPMKERVWLGVVYWMPVVLSNLYQRSREDRGAGTRRRSSGSRMSP